MSDGIGGSKPIAEREKIMSKPKLLYDDVREICIQMVRGYDRRKLNFLRQAAERCKDSLLLADLEEHPETKRMRAVEEAKRAIGLDLPEVMRAKLVDAIMLNCKSGRRYPYEKLNLDEIAPSEFYAQRNRFLVNIARFLQLV